MEKKNYKFPVGNVIAIIISFLLAIMDMFFLYGAVQNVFHQTRLVSMVVSFLIATIANYAAFSWGKENGEKQNKKFTGSAFLWAFIGFLYAAIRAMNIIGTIMGWYDRNLDILSELFQIVVLAVFYVVTGTTIRKSSKEIYDADAVRYRKARKEFEQYHALLIRAKKPIVEDMSTLKNYKKHYASLDRQKNEIERGIEKTENATAATIEGLVMKHNPSINPTSAHQVVVDSLAEARTKFKKEIAKAEK